MTGLEAQIEVAVGIGISALTIGGVFGWCSFKHRMQPSGTRKYGIVYTCLKNAPTYDMAGKFPPESRMPDLYWHTRAAWGCRETSLAWWGCKEPTLLPHPLVYVNKDGESVTCHCGRLVGQYVVTRDAQNVWFRATGELNWLTSAGRSLSDDEAALVTRRQYEAESIRLSGGRFVGPNEEGARRWEPTPKFTVETAGMAMGTRKVIRSEQGDVYTQITCTRCARQMSEDEFYTQHFVGTPATLKCESALGGMTTWERLNGVDRKRPKAPDARVVLAEAIEAGVRAPLSFDGEV